MKKLYRIKLHSNTTCEFLGYYSSKVKWGAVDFNQSELFTHKEARLICNHFNGYKSLGTRASIESA